MTRLLASLVLTLCLSQPAMACPHLYLWFDHVFGYQSLLYTPLLGRLPAVLDDLAGYVVLGTEVVDNFNSGCEQGRIVQFRSGSYVVCDEYKYHYAGWGTEVVIVARPAASGKSTIGSAIGSCKAHCKMIVTGLSSYSYVFDVLCTSWASDLDGPFGASAPEIPAVPESPEPTPAPNSPVDLPDVSDDAHDDVSDVLGLSSFAVSGIQEAWCPPGGLTPGAAQLCRMARSAGQPVPSICGCE